MCINAMARTNWRNRIIQQASLPIWWIEAGNGDHADITNPIYKFPNVYPFVGLDLRQSYDATTGNYAWVSQTATQAADAHIIYIMWIRRKFLEATGRELSRYAVVFRGPDANWSTTNDGPVNLTHHAGDGGKLLDHTNGRAETLAYMTTYFARLKYQHDLNGIPYPEMWLTDFESMGDAQYNAFNSGTGWADIELNGGAPYPGALPGLTAGYSPLNAGPMSVCWAAASAYYLGSLNAAIRVPLVANFPNCKFGEWAYARANAAHPAPWKPGVAIEGPDVAMDVNIPVNYGSPPVFRPDDDNAVLSFPDQNWETTDNWAKATDMGAGFVATTKGHKTARVATAVGSKIALESCRASPSARLVPSVTLQYMYDAPDFVKQRQELFSYIANCTRMGAVGFWAFEPPLGNYTADWKAKLLEFIDQSNDVMMNAKNMGVLR